MSPVQEVLSPGWGRRARGGLPAGIHPPCWPGSKGSPALSKARSVGVPLHLVKHSPSPRAHTWLDDASHTWKTGALGLRGPTPHLDSTLMADC